MEDLPMCNICNKEMGEGYVVDDGLEHYCSLDCLNEIYSDLEYQGLYEEGYAFWTTYEE